MTLPTNIIFPNELEWIFQKDGESQTTQWQEFIFTLQRMYEDIVDVVNGEIVYVEEPTVSGGASAGTGGYLDREAWQRRSGLMTEYWFDIEWNSHNGSGALTVDLPFYVAKSNYMPFVGVVETSSINYTAGYNYAVLNATPETTQGVIRECGDNVASQAIAIPSSGRIKGYVRYIGQEQDENQT